jgi:metal-responsive CopG/Arc/MetJ family transcriptional regulator
MAKKKVVIPVVQKRRIFSMELPAAMFEEVEAFRFRNRFSSRTAAIRWMIDYALKRNHKISFM